MRREKCSSTLYHPEHTDEPFKFKFTVNGILYVMASCLYATDTVGIETKNSIEEQRVEIQF